MKKKIIYCIFFCSLINGENMQPSYPFITGDGFRAMANHIFDANSNFFDIPNIKKNDIIYVNASRLTSFFRRIFPHIRIPFILISHNDDASVSLFYKKYLSSYKITQWFAQNIENVHHPKLKAIPIGLKNRSKPIGAQISKIGQFIKKHHCNKKRDIFVYANYIDVHPDRSFLRQNFKNQSYIYWSPHKPLFEYLKDISNSVFVLSPRGRGLDCHRTWEALLLGAYPVIKTSASDEMYKDLPVVILNDWNELTKELLEQKLEEFKNRTFKMEKCYFNYWRNLINSYRK